MHLHDKQDRFLAGSLIADRILDAADLADVGAGQAAHLRNVLFETGAAVQCPVLPARAQAFFGAFSYVNGGGYLRDRVFVGRFCSIGRRVTIGAGNHFTTGLSTSPILSGGHAADRYSPDERARLGLDVAPRKAAITRIGCDVWIGDGAIVLPGLSIGHGAVIGANAVVTRDVAPYAVMGGVPARLLKMRFPALQIQALLDRLADLGPPTGGVHDTFGFAG